MGGVHRGIIDSDPSAMGIRNGKGRPGIGRKMIQTPNVSSNRGKDRVNQTVAQLDRRLEELGRQLETATRRAQETRLTHFTEALNRLSGAIRDAKYDGTWRRSHFNIFAVLGRQRLEETHSNVLAWLLDPCEAHGLGPAFLEALLSKVSNPTVPPNSSGVIVEREKQEGGGRPDIVVHGEGWYLVIENKIDTRERNGQTHRYAQRCGAKPGLSKFFYYLTPRGDEPDSSEFTSVTYRTIRQVLEKVIEERKPTADAEVLIRHLCTHILTDLETEDG